MFRLICDSNVMFYISLFLCTTCVDEDKYVFSVSLGYIRGLEKKVNVCHLVMMKCEMSGSIPMYFPVVVVCYFCRCLVSFPLLSHLPSVGPTSMFRHFCMSVSSQFKFHLHFVISPLSFDL
jgi:hypothetical protein